MIFLKRWFVGQWLVIEMKHRTKKEYNLCHTIN